jgi:hypothetical protein
MRLSVSTPRPHAPCIKIQALSGLGYNAPESITLEERREKGRKLEEALKDEDEAAKAPHN